MKKQIFALLVVVSVMFLSACSSTHSVKNSVAYKEKEYFSSFYVPRFTVVCESKDIYIIKGNSLPQQDGQWAIKSSNPCNDNKSELAVDINVLDEDIMYSFYGYNVFYIIVQYNYDCNPRMFESFSYVQLSFEGLVANEVAKGRSMIKSVNHCLTDF